MSAKKRKHPKITFTDPKKDYDNKSRFKEKEEEENNEGPCFISHLQPEVLPLELMKTLLVTRGAGEDILKDKSLEEIIHLFYKHITPKPQRIYRQNRRGKELSRNRGKCVKIQNDFQKDYKILETSKSSSSNKAKDEKESNIDSTVTPRLKRPIACVDSQKKKIKLSSSSSSSLDSIKIIDKSKKIKVTSSKNSDKELERSKIESSKSSTVVVNKKIKLDREGSSSSSSSSAATTSSASTSAAASSSKSSLSKQSSNAKEEKIKKKLISWP